jgi:DNA-binding MarR family transcriptional regulator
MRELSPRELDTLRVVTEHPGVSVVGVREALGLSEARTGHLVASLEADHIRREGNPR